MEALEETIQYHFKQKPLLEEALTHSSYGYEMNCPHNERLEFLGDAILGYVVSQKLFLDFPEDPEGTLSKMKSVLVSAPMLEQKAREIQLGASLRLGKGERKAGGHKKRSILADAMEALIGAISLDGGFVEAERFIYRLFDDDLRDVSRDIKDTVDFKTLLQERLQELGLGLPNYVLVREEGPAHNRRFFVYAEIAGYKGPEAMGTSKKTAQQECARLLLNDNKFWDNHAPSSAEN